MIKSYILRELRYNRLSIPFLRSFNHGFTEAGSRKSKGSETEKVAPSTVTNSTPVIKHEVSGSVSHKYQIFQDADANEIFDVEEERYRYQNEPEPKNTEHNEYLGLNLNHGKHGVYDVEDLVDVLRKENAEDVFVCSVPKDLNYVDYMVVCSGRSYRHMLAIAEFVRRIYKVKRTKGDILPKIEGENSRQWMALDLDAREQYDLESLWAIGIEYDKETHKPQDPLVELFEKHSITLGDTHPKGTITSH
ncbi:PREDICTED: uncharacterized protein LOC108970914 isoform X2 [Bactrocera latifrons]|uniref:Mitochondrial assembly of ribosomal large subunit protein 1 n=1 Tax=Bactrocera latifrons TaxID=174628 RepID=A0A0K8W0S5_BACLA|nr:PREDICTED: uncharacterized protein LOC108970914 isoform X2 [Bactrocera latifrons]